MVYSTTRQNKNPHEAATMVSFTTTNIAIMGCFISSVNLESVTTARRLGTIGLGFPALTLSEAQFLHLCDGPKITSIGAKQTQGWDFANVVSDRFLGVFCWV